MKPGLKLHYGMTVTAESTAAIAIHYGDKEARLTVTVLNLIVKASGNNPFEANDKILKLLNKKRRV